MNLRFAVISGILSHSQTYDRFQLRFTSEADITTFLATIYAHFPSLDPSIHIYHAQQPEPLAESMAVSQGTQVYLPGDLAWRVNRRSDPVRNRGPESPMKRRKLNDENVYYGREESVDVGGAARGDRGDMLGHGQPQGSSMRPRGSPVSTHSI